MLKLSLTALLQPNLAHSNHQLITAGHQLLRRVFASNASDAASKDSRHGQPIRSIVPFSVTPAVALEAFKQYQKAACFNLHAGNLLKAQYQLQPAFLPFYLFEATISAEAIATLGRKADKKSKSSPLVWTKLSEWKQIQSNLLLQRSEPCMQVYASYRFRRDLAEAAKPSASTLTAAVALTDSDLQQQYYTDTVAGTAAGGTPSAQRESEATASADRSSTSSSSGTDGSSSESSSSSSSSSSETRSTSTRSSNQVPLDVPDMRQAIAWQLCHRQIMHRQIQAAAQHFKSTMAADEVRDLQVRLTVHSRSVRLAYFPAYHLNYIHGEKYTPSRADIVPAEYDAVVGGSGAARVVAELHPSPIKSQAAAAAAVTSMGLGVIPFTSFALGFDPTLASIAGADAAFLAVLAATGAGALASRLPLIARNRHAAEQAAAERKFYRQYDQRETAYGAPPDEHTLWLWKDADWRKWEQEERWAWVPAKRKKWAEELFRQQAQRDIDRIAAAKQQEQQNQQRQEEEEREAKRESRFGRSRRFAHNHGGPEEPGARMRHQQTGPRRRRDFLGYYKALGINLEEAGSTITADFIKSHYKAAALKLHPDRHVHADDATQKRTAERFRRLQLAYETLRDAEKRRAYDQGRLVQ